jgi:hypothetical protein
MPEVVSNTFRKFTPHKPEKHRIDNGKEGQVFNAREDTVFDYPSIIQKKLGGSWEQYNGRRYPTGCPLQCPINA